MLKFKYTILILFLSIKLFAQKIETNVLIKEQNIIVNTVHKDFGVLYKGDKAEFKFKLKNNNDTSLVIWHVTSSCGCTSPYWTDKPIKKHKKAIIKVVYNTFNIGEFNKSIFVYTRFADKPIKLTISGNVINEKKEIEITKKEINFNSNIPLNK